MYEKSTIINDRVIQAKDIVLGNRKKYDFLMKIIEEFIVDNDIIVRSNENYFFDLYTTNMTTLPKQLTDLLYQSNSILSKYVTLVIKIYKYHSRIIINGITFIHFTYLNPEIRKNIIHYEISCVFIDKKYKSFGPEIQLINIYEKLVNPTLLHTWEELYKKENISIKLITDDLKKRIYGGDEKYIKINKIIDNFISNKHVVIGQLAIIIYQKKKNYKVNRIQLITENKIEDEIIKIKKLIPSVEYFVCNLKVPTNLNLHKITFYTVIDNKKYNFLDIYDAGNYELISFNKCSFINKNISINPDIQVGSPFIIKRFRLIDIWSTLFITNIGSISAEDSKFIINKLIDDIIMIDEINVKIDQLFSTNYIGFLEDPILIKERVAIKLRLKYIIPYTPVNNKNIK